MATDAAILGIGTSLPRHRVRQAEAANLVARGLGDDPPTARFVRRVFNASKIEERRFCHPPAPEGSASGREVADASTAERMALATAYAVPLAAGAARKALAQAGRRPEDVTHLVVTTNTGAHLPGPDVDLARLLGLHETVDRTLIAFTGCTAAFTALRLARRAICADSSARALVVSVEVSSIHRQARPAPDSLVAHALFGDGASAAVLEADAGDARPLVRLGKATHRLDASKSSMLTWRIGNTGFLIGLSKDLPQAIGQSVGDLVEPLGVPANPPDFWCIHPGGAAILDAVERALDLPESALRGSREVMRCYGNMASASILFVLSRELQSAAPGSRGVLLAFGPGLTLEALEVIRGS